MQISQKSQDTAKSVSEEILSTDQKIFTVQDFQ